MALKKQKTLTLVIPLYNEGERIEKTLKTLKKGFPDYGLKLTSVIFVNDGSTDNTKKKVEREVKRLERALCARVRVLSYRSNRGRGYAIRFSSLITDSDYVLYADGDLSIPLQNLKNFRPYVVQGYDLLFGSKKMPGAQAIIPRSTIRKIVGYGHTVIASLLLGVFAWDYQGGFKMFSRKLVREVFPLLSIDRWGFDMEVIFLSKKLGYSTVEVPILWSHVESGSKVKLLRDIGRSLREMSVIKYNWIVRRNVSISVLAHPKSFSLTSR